MDDMARLASRLVVMAEGRILASGTPREIFAQEEMMVSAGLGVPEAARLCRELRAKGIDLPADLYRPDELKDHLLKLWSSRKGGSAC
jgi:energy-coupling factor transport system ATP-binding protein